MSRKMKSALSLVSIVLLLVTALLPQAAFAANAEPAGSPKQAPRGPMLVLSDIECVNGTVVAHFVLNKIPAGATVSDFTAMGDLTGATVEGPNFVGRPERVAHFYAKLEGDGSSVYNVQASVKVNAETINLLNAGNYTIEPCGVQQEPEDGTLKICKALAEGTTVPSGTLFTFSVSGMEDPVSVAPGTCAQLSVEEGTYTVTETGPTGYQVTAIDFLAGSGTPDLGAGSTTAVVVGGQTTEVRFTNAALPAPATGTLKICKALAEGTTVPAGTLFTFSVSGVEDPVSIAAGSCSFVTVPAGQVTVTETGPEGYEVTAIDFLAGSGTPNLDEGSATATIVANQTTEVRFTNAAVVPATGTLKICKALAEGTTVPAGTLFTFSVTGQENPVSVAPGTCAQLVVDEGTYTVTETGPSGYVVTDIRFLSGSGTPDIGAGSTTAVVVANQTTEVQFTNALATGYIQICKETTGGLTGDFSFTSPAFQGTQTITVAPGATQPVCGPLTQVTAGEVSVTEATGEGFELTGVRSTGPGTGLMLNGQTATITVPAGGPETQTQIIFANAPTAAYIQVCKETTGGLTGDFSFTSPSFEGTQTITVAPGATQPVCGPVTEVDAGQVTVTEASGAGYTMTGVRETGPGTDLTVNGMSATVTVPAGSAGAPTQIIFANAPTTGYVQVCKVTEGGLTGSFNFTSPSFAGTQTITVNAGATQPVCGPLTQVTAGEVSVTEEAGAGFVLKGVTTNGPGTNLTVNGQTATVTIPAGGPETQTQIIFTNAPPPVAYIQVCKETTGGLTGTFTFTSPAFSAPQTITVYPGATQPVCAGLTQVTAGEIVITEQEGAGYTLGNVRSNGPGSVTYSGWVATATIPAGGPEQQTQIIFRNDPVAP